MFSRVISSEVWAVVLVTDRSGAPGCAYVNIQHATHCLENLTGLVLDSCEGILRKIQGSSCCPRGRQESHPQQQSSGLTHMHAAPLKAPELGMMTGDSRRGALLVALMCCMGQ